MHDEDDQPKPLSSEPLDVALRLRGYIDGLVDSTERDTEDPPWFISLCSREAKPHIERAQGCWRTFVRRPVGLCRATLETC